MHLSSRGIIFIFLFESFIAFAIFIISRSASFPSARLNKSVPTNTDMFWAVEILFAAITMSASETSEPPVLTALPSIAAIMPAITAPSLPGLYLSDMVADLSSFIFLG